ncbi:MAG: thioesterase family protein [Acidimicrobiia bacterium]|nr:thioesterase family protein [Acidimicrobiia bacterium]
MKLLEFLGGEKQGDGSWRFDLGRELHGAFGGANGGVVAAACLATARDAVPGRVPAGLDARFLRGLTAGTAHAVPTILHQGRTLAIVSVDLFDERDKLCTRGSISFVDPSALASVDDPGQAGSPKGWCSHAEGKPWARPGSGIRVPLIETFDPHVVGNDERGIATSVRVLWDEPGTCAEAACIAADISVGPRSGRRPEAARSRSPTRTCRCASTRAKSCPEPWWRRRASSGSRGPGPDADRGPDAKRPGRDRDLLHHDAGRQLA